MNVTDETNRKLSEESYNNHAINDTIQTPTGNFKVIEKRDNTRNGFRAYVFAPVVNGKVDTSHIYPAFAGTDPLSTQDLITDIQIPFHHNTSNGKINDYYKNLDNTTIDENHNSWTDKNDIVNTITNYGKAALMLSLRQKLPITTKYDFLKHLDFTKATPTQMDESVAYMDGIREKYPNSEIHGNAHSLGAIMAQINTVNGNMDGATTFAGPNTNGTYPSDVQKDINDGKYDKKIKNIGHADDVVNRLTFFKPRIGTNVTVPPKYDGFLSRMPLIGQHFMGTYDDFDKDGNAKGMSENDVKKYKEMRMKLYLGLPFAIEYGPIFAKGMINSFIKSLKEKIKADKASKTKKGSKSTSKSSKSVKGDSDASAKKGNGGSGGSGKKIKIQPEAVRAIVSDLRDRIHKYDDVLRTIEEYERETKKSSQRILDKYESELLSGSHKFISPNDLAEYMEALAQGGSVGNLEFYDNHLMEQVTQDIHQNKKALLQFAEKLEYAADKFEEKDLEESDVFGLFS